MRRGVKQRVLRSRVKKRGGWGMEGSEGVFGYTTFDTWTDTGAGYPG